MEGDFLKRNDVVYVRAIYPVLSDVNMLMMMTILFSQYRFLSESLKYAVHIDS